MGTPRMPLTGLVTAGRRAWQLGRAGEDHGSENHPVRVEAGTLFRSVELKQRSRGDEKKGAFLFSFFFSI